MECYSLHNYVLHADLNGVKTLLAQGAMDLNELDENGQTPLHLAVLGGYDDIVQVLLEAGADPNTFSSDGVTSKWRAQDFSLHHIEILLATYGEKALTDNRFDSTAFTAFYQALGWSLPQVER